MTKYILVFALCGAAFAHPIDFSHQFVSDRSVVDKLLEEVNEEYSGPHSKTDYELILSAANLAL